jgi:hypothetical protein
MALIRHSKNAPAEAVRYSLMGETFELSGTKTYETSDPDVLSNALDHPWLEVDYGQVKMVQGAFVDQIDPKDDPMSMENDNSNDFDAATAAEAAKTAEMEGKTAIDAGLEQKVPEKVADVAVTLAADPTTKTSDAVKKGD